MGQSSAPVLWIVVPCYNEGASGDNCLELTAPGFLGKLRGLIETGDISPNSRVLFVNDGSSDNTWEIIRNLATTDPRYLGVSLSRNQGHQNALLAGLVEAREQCDIAISVDCDGQDDVHAIKKNDRCL